MSPMSNHPLDARDLYTPMNEQVRAVLEQMRQRYGSWRMVAEVTNTKIKVLRNIRNNRKTVSMKVLDRMCSATGIGSVDDFEWFKASDLAALGIWDPVVRVEGRRRVQADKEWVGQPKKIRKKYKTRPRRVNEFGIPIAYLPGENEHLPDVK